MEINAKNNKMAIIIGAIIAVIVLTIGISYAIFSAQSSTTTQQITSGNLSIGFETGNILRTTGITPIKEVDINEKATEINFTVTNTGNIVGYFDINLTEIEIDEELKDSYFKWRLIENDVIINEGNFLNVATTKQLYNSLEIESKGVRIYKLLIWLEDSNTPQNEMQGKALQAKITVSSKNLKLSSSYQEIEYIKSTGTQWIDTGFIPNQDTRVVVDYQYVEVVNGFLFGARTSNNINAYTVNVGSSATAAVTSFGSTGNVKYATPDTNRHTIDKNKNLFYVDGNLLLTQPEQTFTSTGSIEIFAAYSDGSTGYLPCIAKIYSFKIYNNGELVRNFVPCYRKSDGVAGLYDLVENKFYINNGTGTFDVENNI